MKQFSITIAGSGSTRTPGVFISLMDKKATFPVKRVVMYDIDSERQEKIAALVRIVLKDANSDIELITTTDPKTAFTGADYVFTQIRAGGMECREWDEKIPLRYGCVGQETCGAGGFAYGMRSIRPMLELVELVEKYAPSAWILNYSNPASIVAEALRHAKPNSRVINICDMPVGIEKAVGQAIGIDRKYFEPHYFGINHFGWYTHIYHTETGEDLLPMIREKIIGEGIAPLKDPKTEKSWFETYGMLTKMMELFPEYLPNTYMQYYLFPDKVVEKSDPNWTRTNEIAVGREQRIWEAATTALERGTFEGLNIQFSAHGEFIIDLAESLALNKKTRFLLITENNGAIPNLPADAMVEIPARLGVNGMEPVARGPIPLFYQGLIMAQLCAEKLLVEAYFENSYQKALQAFTLNKTVPSAAAAKLILDDLIVANKGFWPELR